MQKYTPDVSLLLVHTPADEPYKARLKPIIGSAKVWTTSKPVVTVAQIIQFAKSKNVTGVISTSVPLLKKLLGKEGERKDPSLDDYSGSMFVRDGVEIVFIKPLAQLVSVSYGWFLAERAISKFTQKEHWPKATPFVWEYAEDADLERIYNLYTSAIAIAIDIETGKEPEIHIKEVGYTAIHWDEHSKKFTTHSSVIRLSNEYKLAYIRKINALPAAKIMQNGKYDTAYLLRYNAPPYNYLHDTKNYFYCWYSELPKSLGFLSSFFVREAMYWKDMAESEDFMTRMMYNAKDTWATANVWLAMMAQMPDWARQNYLINFPVVFPAIMCEMRGLKKDAVAVANAREVTEAKINKINKSLDAMLGKTDFNTGSPKQVKQLLDVLGCKHLDGTGEKELQKAIYLHPLNARILNLVLESRGEKKLLSTYLKTEGDFNGRTLYTLNPDGTDSGRLSSGEHHFWCGQNIQNAPRDGLYKQTIIADNGFRVAESDYEQAESRDTAYVSGDETLINAVTGTRDFHSVNASAFFGVPYDAIYSDKLKSVLNKVLRNLAKRVNHGANYVMGPRVLVDTMGYEMIEQARKLLGLSKLWSHIKIAEYLLEQFHRTYPSLRRIFYTGVKSDVVLTKKLVGATGWTRYCFKDPVQNKNDFNSYVAHVPQSLNAMTLNKAFLRVFYEIALHPEHSKNFKLNAQIHDSILFQFREGHEYLCELVVKCMEIPIKIKGYDGKWREFTVPAAVKAGKDGKGAIRWSDTE